MEVPVRSLDEDESVGALPVSPVIFGLSPARLDLMHRVVRWQLAKRRAGTHKVKGRSEIARTGGKLSRQKGTGRARHGSARVVQFRGGGVVHGPVVRSHEHSLPKKVRSLGLRYAISAKAEAGKLLVFEVINLPSYKTKIARQFLSKFGLTSALFVTGADNAVNLRLAIRNIANIDVLPVCALNVYDILRHDVLVLTKSAVLSLEDRFREVSHGG